MALTKPAAYGLYSQDVALREVIGTLNQAGFGNEDICVMLSPTHPISTIVRDARILDPERKTALSAGMIGWLSKFGAVLIPTVGFFARSQAFFHAMMAAMDSPALCASSRTLVALGFPEFEAERFEDHLHHRGALIYISCAEAAETNWAMQLLQHTGAKETATLDQDKDKGRKLMSEAAA
ncbi:MAG: hypothetical protein WBX02_00530 [Terriglobales bacterium]